MHPPVIVDRESWLERMGQVFSPLRETFDFVLLSLSDCWSGIASNLGFRVTLNPKP